MGQGEELQRTYIRWHGPSHEAFVAVANAHERHRDVLALLGIYNDAAEQAYSRLAQANISHIDVFNIENAKTALRADLLATLDGSLNSLWDCFSSSEGLYREANYALRAAMVRHHWKGKMMPAFE